MPIQEDTASFIPLADALHGYPVTKIGWEPTRIYRESWKDVSTELLTTTGDALRIWEFSDDYTQPTSYAGQQSTGPPGKLTQKIALSSVSLTLGIDLSFPQIQLLRRGHLTFYHYSRRTPIQPPLHSLRSHGIQCRQT